MSTVNRERPLIFRLVWGFFVLWVGWISRVFWFQNLSNFFKILYLKAPFRNILMMLFLQWGRAQSKLVMKGFSSTSFSPAETETCITQRSSCLIRNKLKRQNETIQRVAGEEKNKSHNSTIPYLTSHEVPLIISMGTLTDALQVHLFLAEDS